jgi:hypothetical protein
MREESKVFLCLVSTFHMEDTPMSSSDRGQPAPLVLPSSTDGVSTSVHASFAVNFGQEDGDESDERGHRRSEPSINPCAEIQQETAVRKQDKQHMYGRLKEFESQSGNEGNSLASTTSSVDKPVAAFTSQPRGRTGGKEHAVEEDERNTGEERTLTDVAFSDQCTKPSYDLPLPDDTSSHDVNREISNCLRLGLQDSASYAMARSHVKQGKIVLCSKDECDAANSYSDSSSEGDTHYQEDICYSTEKSYDDKYKHKMEDSQKWGGTGGLTGIDAEAENIPGTCTEAKQMNVAKNDNVSMIDTSSETYSGCLQSPKTDLTNEGEMVSATGDVHRQVILQQEVKEKVLDSTLVKDEANETNRVKPEEEEKQETGKQECPIWQILKHTECPFKWVPDIFILRRPDSVIQEDIITHLAGKFIDILATVLILFAL